MKRASGNRYSPPEYLNVTFSNVHPSQSNPSSMRGAFLKANLLDLLFDSGGTTGLELLISMSPMSAGSACDSVVITIPESAMQQDMDIIVGSETDDTLTFSMDDFPLFVDGVMEVCQPVKPETAPAELTPSVPISDL